MVRTEIPLLAAALLLVPILLPDDAADAAAADPGGTAPPPAATGGDVRIGVPGGVTFDAFAHPGNGEVYVFVRFAEPRSGDLVVTFRTADGVDLATRTVALERGSAMLLWDRATDDGGVAAGACTACLTIDGSERTVALTLP